ncbi:hypothetical protein K432DRAFT_463254 [Lepidopterella palustris CBS 459.81]|uniref:Transposase n=1 Tax=Lepidopterella palustris CBS 459.81 TaxID=1314670 RepID=A0A8E2JIW2_9PEZI|nr:hypothetical protein K432DRAFT_463254 [Lepidopterella palustris CBS 459.81]
MNSRGYYKDKACKKRYLGEANAVKKDIFCGTLIVTDEVHFQLESRRTDFVTREDERHCEQCIKLHRRERARIYHAWVMVDSNYKSPIRTNHGGNLTMRRYLDEIFKPHIEPKWRGYRDLGTPLTPEEDNGGSHGTRRENNMVHLYKLGLGENF